MKEIDECTHVDVHTSGGGEQPPCVGLASNALPEAQSLLYAESSQTGDTSNFVPKENYQWFVFRVLYGHSEDAIKALDKAKIQIYIPMHHVKVEISGKERLRKVPLLPGLIFAYMTREMTHKFVKQPARTARFLKYYTDKTKPIEPNTHLNPPITIADNTMKNFIKASSIQSEHSMMLSTERCHFKKNEMVRIIKGAFKGIVGKVTRVEGQQRVGIEIDGIGTFVTAYIPKDFMEKLYETKK